MKTPAEIAKILKNPVASASLAEARAIQEKHKLIVKGIGFKKAVLQSRFLWGESKSLFDAKVKYARPATPALFQKYINQYNKIFRADGFNESIVFDQSAENKKKDAELFLSSFWGGKSLDHFMECQWAEDIVENFNGVYLVDLPDTDDSDPYSDTANPFIQFYGLESIYDIFEDATGVVYVVLKKIVVNEAGESVEQYRYIDRDQDSVFIKKNDDFIINSKNGNADIIEYDEPQLNVVRISEYLFSKDYPALRVNYLNPGVELGEQYQDLKNDHVIAMKKHGYPHFFSRPVVCNNCNGKGTVFSEISELHPEGLWSACTKCNGAQHIAFHKGDVTEGIVLPLSLNPDGNMSKAEAPAGYIENDIDSLKEMAAEKVVRKSEIEEAVLGAEGIVDRKNAGDKTATGEVINYQPLLDRMFTHSTQAQIVHNFLGNALLRKRYGPSFKSFTKRYGREYLVKTESDIMTEYSAAKKAGLPASTLFEYLKQFVKTKFANDPDAKERALFLLQLEPFPTYTVPEVNALNLADGKDAQIKLYFNDLVEQFERDNLPITDFEPDKPFSIRKNLIYKAFEDILINWGVEFPLIAPDPVKINPNQ